MALNDENENMEDINDENVTLHLDGKSAKSNSTDVNSFNDNLDNSHPDLKPQVEKCDDIDMEAEEWVPLESDTARVLTNSTNDKTIGNVDVNENNIQAPSTMRTVYSSHREATIHIKPSEDNRQHSELQASGKRDVASMILRQVKSKSTHSQCLYDITTDTPTCGNGDKNNSSSIQKTTREEASSSSTETLEKIRTKLETSNTLKKGLVEHPLHNFWGIFIRYLTLEIWRSNIRIRVGLIAIAIGSFLQIMVLSTLLLPNIYTLLRTVIATFIIMALSYIYLTKFDTTFHSTWTSFHRKLFSSSDPWKFFAELNLTILENLNKTQGFRKLCLLLVIMPTFMEMKALLFLATTIADYDILSWFQFFTIIVAMTSILIYVHFDFVWVDPSSTDTNNSITIVSLIGLRKNPATSLQQCRIHTWASLYISALLVVTLFGEESYKRNFLLAPFLLTAGSFLLSVGGSFGGGDDNGDGEELDGLSRVIRNSLRSTLREVMACVGENVAEDEMLQLAMLRWIVDYWSSSVPSMETSRSSSGSLLTNQRSGMSPSESSDDQTEIGSNKLVENDGKNTHLVTEESTVALQRSEDRPRRRPIPSGDDTIVNIYKTDKALNWEELWSMLSVTTEQMYSEVASYDHQVSRSRNFMHAGFSPSQSNSSTNGDHGQNNNHSVQNLQSMLSSFDVDARAKPAVLSYKKAIEEFPPKRNVAIIFALVRRCPGLLTLSSLYLLGSDNAVRISFSLLPIILVEVMRVEEWLSACRKSVEIEDCQKIPLSDGRGEKVKQNLDKYLWIPENIDPMHILLSGDNYSPYYLSSPLRVWSNIKSSVNALELGLVAARCVHTAHVAKELAFDAISLAKFAVEVHNKGWFHGLQTLLLDVFHFHADNNKLISDDRSAGMHGTRSQYTNATLSVARNGRILSRNVNALLEERNEQSFAPLVNMIASFLDQGWLWGREKEDVSKCSNQVILDQNECEERDEQENSGEINTISIASEVLNIDSSNIFDEKDEDATRAKVETIFSNASLHGNENIEKGNDADVLDSISRVVGKKLITEQETNELKRQVLSGKEIDECQTQTRERVVNDARQHISYLVDSPNEKDTAVNINDHEEKNEGTNDFVTSDGIKQLFSPTKSNLESISAQNMKLLDDLEIAESSDDIESQCDSEQIDANKELDLGKSISSFDKVEINQDGFDELSDDESWTEIERKDQGSEVIESNLMIGVYKGDESHVFCDNGYNDSVQTLSKEGDQAKDEDWKKWVGGGLAVLGAVVGGIALVNSNQHPVSESNKERKSDDDRNRSEMEVEILDSDDM